MSYCTLNLNKKLKVIDYICTNNLYIFKTRNLHTLTIYVGCVWIVKGYFLFKKTEF